MSKVKRNLEILSTHSNSLKQIPSKFTTDEPLKNMFWKVINHFLSPYSLVYTLHTVWIFQKFSTKILREINFRDSLFVHSIDSTEFYVKSTLGTQNSKNIIRRLNLNPRSYWNTFADEIEKNLWTFGQSQA